MNRPNLARGCPALPAPSGAALMSRPFISWTKWLPTYARLTRMSAGILRSIEKFQDWTEYEAEAMYLEGTGSMVMDHKNKIIYACLSPRTHHTLLEKFAATNGYRAIAFTAENEKAIPIYHTNVMMSVGDGFSVVCPKVIPDYTERIAVTQLLEATGHENIYIEPDLLKNFAANLLQVKNKNGNLFIAISKTALDIFPKSKLNQLEKYGELLPIDVSVIEKVNGGSVRCMIAEIFLQPIN